MTDATVEMPLLIGRCPACPDPYTSDGAAKCCVLPEEVSSRLNQIGSVDLLIGLIGHGEVEGEILSQVTSLRPSLAKLRTALILPGVGTAHEPPTAERDAPAFQQALVIRAPSQEISPIFLTLEAGHALNARACVIVDPETTGLSSSWLDAVVAPILQEGYDCVLPSYARCGHDGLLIDTLLYPLTQMLFGRDLRQPQGCAVGLSSRLLNRIRRPPVWDGHVCSGPIGLWSTAAALAGEYRLAQPVFSDGIGSEPNCSENWESAFVSIMQTVFAIMQAFGMAWKHKRIVSPVAVKAPGPTSPQVALTPDVKELIHACRSGILRYTSDLRQILTPASYLSIDWLPSSDDASFSLPAVAWARILFDFAVAYQRAPLPSERVLPALYPLYLGRAASFLLETAGLSDGAKESAIRKQSRSFTMLKEELVERWQ